MPEPRGDSETIVAEWDDLVERVGASPFLRPGYIHAMADAFPGGSLEVFSVRRGGRLAALIPLFSARGALRSPTSYHTPEFAPVAEDAAAAGDLARVVLAARPRSLSLQFVEMSEPITSAFVEAACSERYRLLARLLEHCPFIEVGSTWEEFEVGLDTKLRADLRRRRRRLEELGETRVEVATGTEDLERLLAEGMRVEAAGWKGALGTAIDAQADTRELYHAIARWAAPLGWLRLAFLRVDEQAIAFEFCVEARGVHYRIKAGYDEAYRRFAPGKVLQLAMLERAFREGIRRYEFLGADEPYKLEWAPSLRDLSLVQLFAPTPSGVVERFAYEVGRPVAKRVVSEVRERVQRRRQGADRSSTP